MEPSSYQRETARSESLVKWVNNFVHCSSVKDLASGEILLQCIQKITPEVEFPCSKTPWEQLFFVLEDFCGCTLERAVDSNKVLAGDQEHISRVVVLLLSVAVQSKNNSSIIAGITSLDYEVQRDLMFFIESTLTKVKSHAILAGTFTSGVGEALPSLSDSPAVQRRCLFPDSSGEDPDAPPAVNPSSNSSSSGGGVSSDGGERDLVFATPRKPPSRFFNGLDSPAGAMLLMSPAITGRRRRVGNVTPTRDGEDKDREISRLKHSIRVLEGTLQVEKKLVQEYYDELCTKMQELEDLKKDHSQLERKVGCIQNMTDLQDELAHTKTRLAAAEKDIVMYKSKISGLECVKDRMVELEGKLGGLEYKASKCDEYKMNMKKSEALLLGKTGDLKRMELQLSKVSIELEAKTSHLESLLQENGEIKREVEELKTVRRQLEDTIGQLELNLTMKDAERLAVLEEKREMALEIEMLKSSLQSSKNEVVDLAAEVLAKSTTLTTLEKEKGELHQEIASRTTQLTSVEFELRSLRSTKEELEKQLTHLQTAIKTLEHTHAIKEGKLQRELSDKMSQLADKECVVKSLENSKKMWEEKQALLQSTTKSMTQDITVKTAELDSSKKQVRVLEESKRELEDRVEQLESTSKHLEQEKLATIASTDLQIKSLQDTNLVLETELDKLQCQVRALERQLSAKNEELVAKDQQQEGFNTRAQNLEQNLAKQEAELDSLKDIRKELEVAMKHQAALQQDADDMKAQLTSNQLKIESLEATKKDLEDQVTSKQLKIGSLEGTNKDLEAQLTSKIASLETTKKELEAQLTSNHLKSGSLEAAKKDLQAQLASNQLKLGSLEATKKELESLIAEMRTNRKAMEEDIASKAASLAAKNGRISSLSAQKDELIADKAELKKQLDAAQDKILVHKSNDAATGSLLQECSQLRAKVSNLTQCVTMLQSTVQTTKNVNVTLQAEKTSAESLCAQLEAKLSQQAKQASSDPSFDYASKLKLSEQVIQNLREQKSTMEREMEHQIQNLTKEIQSLKSNQAKLIDDLQSATEKERVTSSQCHMAEADVVMERSKSYQLQERVLALEAELGIRHQQQQQQFLPHTTSTDSLAAGPCTAIPVSMGMENCPSEISEVRTEDIFALSAVGPIDEKARVRELKRRNKQALPHLKSSYPIEMQVRPETPTTSNERLKGSSRSKQALRSSTSIDKLGYQVSPMPAVSGQVSELSLSSCSSGDSSRHSSHSPITSPKSSPPIQGPRVTSDPPTSTSLHCRPRHFPLREYLDSTGSDKKSPPLQQQRHVSSTKFEIALSPPRVKGVIPKRLQENRRRQALRERESDKSKAEQAKKRETMILKSTKKSPPPKKGGVIAKSKSASTVMNSRRSNASSSKAKVLGSRNN